MLWLQSLAEAIAKRTSCSSVASLRSRTRTCAVWQGRDTMTPSFSASISWRYTKSCTSDMLYCAICKTCSCYLCLYRVVTNQYFVLSAFIWSLISLADLSSAMKVSLTSASDLLISISSAYSSICVDLLYRVIQDLCNCERR